MADSLDNELLGNELYNDAGVTEQAPTGNPRHNYTVGDDGQWYNSDGERVYYWVEPAETDSTMGEGSETQGIGQDLGGYYTEAEIKAAWDADEGMGYFKERTDWDSYWGFINERQSQIEAGELTDPIQSGYANNASDYARENTDPDQPSASGRDEEIYYARSDVNEQTSLQEQMGGWVDQNAELMEKYGIDPVFQNEDGDTFMFNGSTYSRTNKIDDHGYYGELIGGALMGLATAGALAPVGAGLFGTGAVGKGVTAGVSNAITQAAMTGEVDPLSVLASGVTAGLNPGGYLATEVGGFAPDNVVAGFIEGAGNSLVSGAIQGDVDVKGALLSGLGNAGMNVVKDFFQDMSDRSLEDRMRLVEHEHNKLYPNGPALTDQELYDAAMAMPGTGTSDLGGLIGEDGLIPGMDEVSTKWANDLLGGGAWNPTGLFIGPDGKQYTDLEMMEKFPDVDLNAVGQASLFGQTVDGFSYALTTQEKTWVGELWDSMKENVPGLQTAIDFVDKGIDAAARAQFIDEYGFDPVENPDAAMDVFIYGKVDETYNWSDDPRGDSEVIGQVYGEEDKYTTGTIYDQTWVESDQTDEWGNSILTLVDHAKIIRDAQDAFDGGASPEDIVASLTDEGVADVVMPGSDITYGDAILSGILDGLNTPEDPDPVVEEEVDLTPEIPGTDEDEFVSLDPRPDDWRPGGPDLPDELDPRPDDWRPGGPPPELPSDDPTPDLPSPDPDLPPDLPPEVSQPPVLPPELGSQQTQSGGVLPGGVLPGGMMRGSSYDPKWGELFAYTTLTPYQKKQLEPMKNYIRTAKEMEI